MAEMAERVTAAVQQLGNGRDSVGKLQKMWTPTGCTTESTSDREGTKEPLAVGSSCK